MDHFFETELLTYDLEKQIVVREAGYIDSDKNGIRKI
jgi:hypothetical protein